MNRDADLRERVLTALAASREIDSVGIDVEVANGVVTLRGEVGSAAERLCVRSLVVADPATLGIVDELSVAALPGEWRLRDDQITALVTERLREHPRLADVVPTCGFRVLKLDGVVPDAEDRRIAHHVARTTRGVHFVIDHLDSVRTS